MKLRFLLLLLSCVEIWLVTYRADEADPYMGPVILLLLSFAIAIIYLLVRQGRTVSDEPLMPRTSRWLPALQIAGFAAVSAVAVVLLHRIAHAYPVSAHDASRSDVVPSIMQMVSHLLEGAWAYQPISFAGYGYAPTYLPMMWLPYTVAAWGHFDFRYIPALIFWLAALYYFVQAISRQQRYGFILPAVVVPVLPLLLWYAVADADNTVMANTVEGTVAGYYLLLAVALSRQKTMLIAVGLGCCLLSRYSLVLWLPLPAMVLIAAGRWRSLAIIGAAVVIMIVLIYWLPFLRLDPSLFSAGYKSYTIATVGEWNNARTGGMWHLGNGLSFSAWMLRLHTDWQIPDIVSRYRKIHLAACAGIVGLLSVGYIIFRKRIHDPYSFLLFSFKVYLAVFYAFVQIPYKYLMLVPLAVTTALVADAYRRSAAPSVHP